MDNFYEQLVLTKKTMSYNLSKIFMVIFGLIGMSLLGINIIFGLIGIGLAVGCYFLNRNSYVEYEYSFTNGEIDIDKIVSMKKRSRVISFNIKDVEILAPEDSYYIKDFSNKSSKVYNLYPKTAEEKIYVAMVTGNGENAQLRFVPNEKFLEICFKYNPRAVKKN